MYCSSSVSLVRDTSLQCNSNTTVHVGVIIFALCGPVGVLVGFEVTRFFSATGVGLLIVVASGMFLCSHKGLAGFAPGSNMIAICSNTTVYGGVSIFALCWSALSMPIVHARMSATERVSPGA